MEKHELTISPRYIVNEHGEKVEVVLDIQTFEKIHAILEDVYFGLQAEKALAEGEFVDFDKANSKDLK